MEITASNVLIEKTRELCQTILDEPEYQTIRQQIETFMGDETAKEEYQLLSEKGEYLQHKQAQGVRLSDEEIAEFEKQREQFFSNPISRGFIDAQQAMHKVQETVGQYLGKTFELGRVPEPDDFSSGGCGPSCGCGH